MNKIQEHLSLSTKIAQEAIVLLKNEGILPFDKSVHTIALYGSGARYTVKGGTGSGDVNVESFITVEQGLANEGYTVLCDEALLNDYENKKTCNENNYYSMIQQISSEKGAFAGLVTMLTKPLVPTEFPSCHASTFPTADAAVYVLSRISGEGADRKLIPGDYYFTDSEIADIKTLSSHYKDFVLLLNVGGVVDLCPILEYTKAIVLMGQGGSGCGDAIASVLSGKITPSGKLTATWAKHYEDYPFATEYASVSGELYDTYYKEDIFVGYRYFNSFDVTPLYPFGYGLSYTNFDITPLDIYVCGSNFTVSVEVKNAGAFSGREVVQLYLSIPSVQLSQPPFVLAAFGKSQLLAPNETQILELSFSLENFASYSEEKAAFLLEHGNYILHYRNSSANITPFAKITITETVITEQCKNLLRSEHMTQPIMPNNSPIPEEHLKSFTLSPSDFLCSTHDYTFATLDEALSDDLTLEDLANLCIGAARINLNDVTLVGSWSDTLPGAAGETTSALIKKGIPAITMADGPAGIRINPVIHEKDGKYIKVPEEDPIFCHLLAKDAPKTDLSDTTTIHHYCTALPIGTMLAQTWDMDLLLAAGKLIGEEMRELHIHLWLAPALNIHRNPLCGRNFEYFSEDPLLSGLCAAAITEGTQSIPGCGVVIKHLAANNQETNRNYNNSHISERALREIYLKGFQICVQNAKPYSVMTSVNLINGVHACSDKQLLTDILRHEWGFDGFVMTDWGTTGEPGILPDQKYGAAYAVDCLKAGNDLIMPGSQRDYDYILNALKNKDLDEALVRRWTHNIISIIHKTIRNGD